MPTCWIIAGPNGTGKTTFALEYLPKVAECTHFVNADLIAAGLSPLMPERELMMALIQVELLSFAFAKLGLPPALGLMVLFLSLLDSVINLPVTRI